MFEDKNFVLTTLPLLVSGMYGDEDEVNEDSRSGNSPHGLGRIFNDLPHILGITLAVLLCTVAFTGYIIYLSEKHQQRYIVSQSLCWI
jgi:hypothetical protein